MTMPADPTPAEVVERLRALMARATPGLVNGGASTAVLAKLLRNAADAQRPRARDYESGFNPDADAALIVAAINALPTLLAQADAGWRGMESAPRDGTYILVSAPDCGCEVVRWSFGTTWTDQAGMTQGDWPTHWRPRPAPPSKEGEGRS